MIGMRVHGTRIGKGNHAFMHLFVPFFSFSGIDCGFMGLSIKSWYTFQSEVPSAAFIPWPCSIDWITLILGNGDSCPAGTRCLLLFQIALCLTPGSFTVWQLARKLTLKSSGDGFGAFAGKIDKQIHRRPFPEVDLRPCKLRCFYHGLKVHWR